MTIATRLPDSQDSITTSDSFRRAMRQLAGGVSILTAGKDREWTGMTATSVTSLSLEPPTVLACINRSASIIPFLERYRHFAVSFLSADQSRLADRFAGRGGFQGLDRFQNDDWMTGLSGARVLKNAVASLDCKLDEMILKHSHFIVIGRVLRADVEEASDALVHWRSGYARLGSSSQRST